MFQIAHGWLIKDEKPSHRSIINFVCHNFSLLILDLYNTFCWLLVVPLPQGPITIPAHLRGWGWCRGSRLSNLSGGCGQVQGCHHTEVSALRHRGRGEVCRVWDEAHGRGAAYKSCKLGAIPQSLESWLKCSLVEKLVATSHELRN